MEDVDPKVVEWEEEKEEEADGKLNNTCDKFKENPEYHNRMISVENVRKVLDATKADSADEVDKIFEELSQTSSLTKDDAVILNHYRSDWKSAFDAVVKLRVKKANGKKSSGTGFLILRPPGYDPVTKGDIFHNFAVMTNFHVVRQKNGRSPLVEHKDIEVTFFYDCDQSDVVICSVSEISPVYSPFVPGMPTDEKLDFAMLYIKHPVNEEEKRKLEDLKPLQFEESGMVQAAELPQIADKKRLCVIGHPHGAYKHIAFGELKTNTNSLYQGGKKACKEDRHFVEHSVATCSGSSGSPVIMIGLKEGKPLDDIFVLQFVPFLHFRGNSKTGDAASMQSIMPAIRVGIAQNN